MRVCTLLIDNQAVSARESQTILEVARESRIAIPTLCHFDGVSEAAACRLCLVEIEGTNKLAASCSTLVNEGMIVRTNTPRLQKYRRTILELLFAERNHVCSVCIANRHCELQDLAVSVGIDHVRYDYLHPSLPMDLSHDRFAIDHNRCVLCTRCVRVCDEIEGAHTWDVMGRGTKARVITDMGDSWGDSVTCTSCGKCVQACPTGALFCKGVTVEEMTHDRSRLNLLILAREKHEWRV